MSEFEFAVRTETWCTVTFRRKLKASVEEVQRTLDLLEPSLNPLQATAQELGEYLDGRGEFALRVSLARAGKAVDSLLNHVALILANQDPVFEDVEPREIEEVETYRVKYEWSRIAHI